MRLMLVAFLVLTAACVMQSCKQGCKDKTAINYNSKATAEDGTCLYCTELHSGDTAAYFFTSANAPTPGASAIEFIVSATSDNISGNGCRSVGQTPTSGCRNTLKMINLTSSHVSGSFIQVDFTQNGQEEWFFSSNSTFIQLGPHGSGNDTINFGVVDSFACSNLTSGTLNGDISNLQFFQ